MIRERSWVRIYQSDPAGITPERGLSLIHELPGSVQSALTQSAFIARLSTKPGYWTSKVQQSATNIYSVFSLSTTFKKGY